ncbi:MAG: transcriptional activator NhaR [Aquabacterium sp.]|uniref:transcriptional activator NhaR n=1 Tax=Aquabacterium sp. TaxID=1872578 RepID=UPI00271568A2|nr:transcriptional activator NhaR [Aquabacterium sp.]MDO9004288.1 transcriptional activator NhaR [Aquabacterium sp.]
MNFKHLYYFWATAKSGGVMKAGEQLHTTPQTLSGQIKLLEAQLGCALFQKVGRRLELTKEGRVALGYADQIFALGTQLEAAVGKVRSGQTVLDFRVGISDSVPKAIAYRLLEPALGLAEPVRLICHEGDFHNLLGQIAVHRLDLVIADEPMGKQVSVKAFSHALGTTAMSFFATPVLKSKLELGGRAFPQCLDGAPMLLQGAASAMRQRLDVWLAEHQLHPRPIGEFDDAALMKAFGGEGRGVFMAPTVLEDETCAQHGVEVLGRTSELVEEFYAISVERRITHPCVVAITQSAREALFGV